MANLGVATGGPEDLVVIDIDPRHGGNHALTELEERHRRLPVTYTVRTGSGGLHLYFSMEGIEPPIRNSQGVLGPGIDVRGEGGYVVAPPSENLMGSYTAKRAAGVAPIPDWVVDLLQTSKRTPQPSRWAHAYSSHKGGFGAVGEVPVNLDDAVFMMLSAEDGCRNHTLNCVAYWAGRRINRGILQEGIVVQRLSRAAELAGLNEDEIERTLWSGLTAGMDKG